MSFDSKEGAFIFIVGSHRSGTNLMFKVLEKHSDIFRTEMETQYFCYLWRVREYFPDISGKKDLRSLIYFTVNILQEGFLKAERKNSLILTEKDVLSIIEDISATCTYEEIFFTIISHLVRKNDKERWIEKTPEHIFFIDQIVKEAPNALFLWLVRDPRDVISSIKILDKYKVWRVHYNPLHSILSYKLFNRTGVALKIRYPKKIIRIRYEDLVVESEKTIRKVCGFLGLRFESDMLNVSHYNPPQISKNQDGFLKGPVGRYKATLSPEEVALCQIINKREMVALNYSMTQISWLHKLNVIYLILRSLLSSTVRLLFDIKEQRINSFNSFYKRLGYLKSFIKLRISR